MEKTDTFNLDRFVTAQAQVYADALAELKSGRKQTHWMWYIFPQLVGLGYSTHSNYYGITGLEEAKEYLAHPLLGTRLRECCEALLALGDVSIADVLGYPDNMKLQSCMTLFESASEDSGVFTRVLDKFYNGEHDVSTLMRLGIS